MYSILHISDLHRTPKAKISNPELISALVRDRDSYVVGDTPIRSPDAIIVSGDVVQGVPLRAPDGQAQLKAQYEEAGAFLAELAKEFLGGDRSRVVIVPGNHDIDWQIAKKAMHVVEVGEFPSDVLAALQQPDSEYRFSWHTRELFRIVDKEMYERRLDAFWEFFRSFYAGVDGLLRVRPGDPANLFSLWGGRIGVAAFNSCHGNDCFAFHGAIPRSLIGQTHLDMRDLGPFELSMAVWHHNLEGPPYRTDYMDIEIVRAMIGRGFRVGLYGHQHRAQVAAQSLRLAESETMAILGTGALCAGGAELPNGSNRQYSIVELNDDLRSARVHVREVMDSDLFGPASLPAFGRKGSMQVGWDRPTNTLGNPIDTYARALRISIEEAEGLLKNAKPDVAMERLWPLHGRLSGYGRQLLIRTLEESRAWPRLVELTANPLNIAELVVGIRAMIYERDWPAARKYLAQNAVRLQLPNSQLAELNKHIDVQETLSTK